MMLTLRTSCANLVLAKDGRHTIPPVIKATLSVTLLADGKMSISETQSTDGRFPFWDTCKCPGCG